MQLASLTGPEVSIESMPAGLEIAGLKSDSRAVRPGDLFAAFAGSRADGSRFIADAVANGAVAILVARSAAVCVPPTVAVLRADEPRRALALMAARAFPGQPAVAVAVTGTSGKTSVADFTRQIFARLGRSAASLGTIGIVKPGGAVYGALTTPDPISLHASLAGLGEEGITHLALEASSHGLDQFRLDGVRLAAAAYTNLGRDHLDYHANEDAYMAAKLRLFRELLEPGQTAVINADGRRAADVIAAARARGLDLITTGRAGETLRIMNLMRDGFGQRAEIAAGGRTFPVRVPLIGSYQVENALVAAGLAAAAGEEVAAALDAIAHLEGVCGRLEIVGTAKGALAVVDYAHKPDALAAALDALRPFAAGRLICLFGCGGDRDRGKRPIMGRIAADMADVVIVTDDNPRSERPEAIRAEILAPIQAGASGRAARILEIGDRGAAIRTGVAMLGTGDVLLVAGKGHETGQIVGDTVLAFSDQEAVRAAMANGT